MKKTIVLTRPLFVKGKGLPKDGVCIAKEGEKVTLVSANGAEWYIQHAYKARVLLIASVPSTL